MRARSEAAIGLAALTLLAFLVGVLARPPGKATSRDERPSTLLAGPGGARALLEGVRALGIEVRRFRKRSDNLVKDLAAPRSSRQAFVIIGPSYPFSPDERDMVRQFGNRADLVLAGTGAELLMRCYGYRIKRRPFDSVQVAPRGRSAGATAPWVHGELVATHEPEFSDSSRAWDIRRVSCLVPPLRGVDTLLISGTGRLAALRLRRGDVEQRVILLADEELLRNRSLRHTDAGPFALGLFERRYDRVVFEEYHHGFGPSGSLAGAALAWSRRSPFGWAVWQSVAVGLLALFFGAIRFGPARPGIARSRRSPLEHVHALAVALSAARGHDEAIAAIVRGLRRRLVPPALRGRAADWRGWLARLARPEATPELNASLASLIQLTRPGQPSASVLRAANAVEDLWQDLRP
jgi:hypothetical protein